MSFTIQPQGTPGHQCHILAGSILIFSFLAFLAVLVKKITIHEFSVIKENETILNNIRNTMPTEIWMLPYEGNHLAIHKQNVAF